MTNLVEHDVEEFQQVRGQRSLLDRAPINIGRLASVSQEALAPLHPHRGISSPRPSPSFP